MPTETLFQAIKAKVILLGCLLGVSLNFIYMAKIYQLVSLCH